MNAIGIEPEEAVGRLYAARPSWVTGYVSHSDAKYLLRRVIDRRTELVVEIGTASSVSTAILCHALELLHRAGLAGSEYEVRTYDLLERFYADESKRTGAAAREMLDDAQLAHVVFRNPARAPDVGEDLGPDAVDLIFIDANHSHPWPALDLLATLDTLRPGAEAIFHDINHPTIRPDAPVRGAQLLFDSVDAPKEADDREAVPNIGSIWIDDKAAVREQLLDLVNSHEWETAVPDAVTEPLIA